MYNTKLLKKGFPWRIEFDFILMISGPLYHPDIFYFMSLQKYQS